MTEHSANQQPGVQPTLGRLKKKSRKWPWIVAAIVVVGAMGSAMGGGEESAGESQAAPAVVEETAESAEEAAAREEAEAQKAAAAEKAEEKAEAEKIAAEEKAAEEAAAAEKAEAKKAAKEAATAKQERISNAQEMSARDLSLLAKSPDDHFGETLVVYGEITQFDAATGACTFRANVAHANMASTWDYEHNAIFTGGDGEDDCPALKDFITDDEVRITATSLGSLSYDTQIGGSTTVPMFMVEKVSLAQ